MPVHHQPVEQPMQPVQQLPTQPVQQLPPHPVHHYEQMPYVPQFEYPTQHAQPEHDGVHPMCPQCYTALEAHARFCGECGYTLPERVPACPTCGAPLETTAKFCGECGMELSSPVSSNSNNLNDQLRRMQGLKDQQQGWVDKLFKIME